MKDLATLEQEARQHAKEAQKEMELFLSAGDTVNYHKAAAAFSYWEKQAAGYAEDAKKDPFERGFDDGKGL